jgi:hypothetical protein
MATPIGDEQRRQLEKAGVQVEADATEADVLVILVRMARVVAGLRHEIDEIKRDCGL